MLLTATTVAAPRTISVSDRQVLYDPSTDRTFFAYLGEERDLFVSYRDHTTDTTATPVEIGVYPIADDDDHGDPSIVRALDGHLHIVWGSHNTPHQHSKSDNPDDISAWTTTSLSGRGTYPAISCDPATGDLYVLDRATTASGATHHGSSFPAHEFGSLYKSIDGGSTWVRSELVDTTGFPESLTDFYPAGGSFFDDGLLHFAWTVARGSTHDETRTNIYYAKYDPTDGHLYAVDDVDLGTVIDWEGHQLCLAATDQPLGSRTLAVDATAGVAIAYTFGGNPDGLRSAIWDGVSWTRETIAATPALVQSRGAIWRVANGWQAAVPAFNGTDGDLVLYGHGNTGWQELRQLAAASVGEGWNKVSPARGGGPVTAAAMQEPAGFVPTSATPADLLDLVFILESDPNPNGPFADDFTGTDDDPWDATLWSQDAGAGGGATTIQANRGQAAGAAGNANSGGRGRGKQGQVANQEMTGTFQLCEINEPCNGALWLQTSDDWDGLDWPTEGYGVRLPSDSDTATLLRASAGVVTELDQASWSRDTGLKHFRFRRQSTKVRFRIWDDGDPEPDGWTLVADDDTLTPDAVGAFQVAYTCPTAPSVDACGTFDTLAVGSNDDDPDPNPATSGCGFDSGYSNGFAIAEFCLPADAGNRIGGIGAIRRSPTAHRAARGG